MTRHLFVSTECFHGESTRVRHALSAACGRTSACCRSSFTDYACNANSDRCQYALFGPGVRGIESVYKMGHSMARRRAIAGHSARHVSVLLRLGRGPMARASVCRDALTRAQRGLQARVQALQREATSQGEEIRRAAGPGDESFAIEPMTLFSKKKMLMGGRSPYTADHGSTLAVRRAEGYVLYRRWGGGGAPWPVRRRLLSDAYALEVRGPSMSCVY